MTYTNNQLGAMYLGIYYTHRGDGTHSAAFAIQQATTLIHPYFAEHGSLKGAPLKGISPRVQEGLERLLRSKQHENPRQ